MAAPLDTSDPELAAAVKEILAGKLNWLTFTYVPKIPTLKLKIDQKGSDEFSDIVENINEGKIQYFYIRFEIVNMPKYCYIAYCGENVTGVLRGAFNSHVHEVANYFKKIQAPVHVQINARSDTDFDEKKIREQLTKAMGSNYDAGAKKQGAGGGVGSTKEGINLHRTAQEEASKTNTARALPNLPQLLETRDQFWRDTNNKQEIGSKPQAKAPVINENERQQFWSKTNTSTQASSAPAKGPIINEQEREQYWQQQQQQKEEPKKAGGVVETPSSGGASSLKSKFEQAAKPAEPSKPAPTGKKWTPPPASSNPPPASKPLVSGPPKSSAPPPAGGPPPTPAGGPPKFAPPTPAGGPPPTPAGGPPKFTPPPPAGGPPKSAPPPEPEPEPAYEPPAQPAYEPPAQPAYEPPAQPAYEPPAQPAYEPPVQPAYEPPAQPADEWHEPPTEVAQTTSYDNTGYEEPAQQQPQPTPAAANDGDTVQAIYAFTAEQSTDLSFNDGDLIVVLDRSDPSGWWKGRDAYGNEGYFPSNFVQPCSG